MRIIAGNLKRKQIKGPPPGAITRPMPDRVRESLFQLLRGHYEGAVVLDAFAGTGIVGLEAISRGAKRCVFIENDKRVARVIEENAAMLGVANRCEVLALDALGPRARGAFPEPVDLVYFDPPYPMVQDPKTWPRVRDQFARAVAMLTPKGFACLRTPWPFVESSSEPDVAASGAEEVIEIDLSDPDADEALERFEAELLGGADPDAPMPRPGDVDLSIEGAEGPETHVYRHTAVHLYMRATSEALSG
ncbi:MAG: RsmD family RNA methyltransferase [Planctomycetota bacterium]